MKTLLIIGAKSDIAKAVAREYAQAGYNLFLAARNSEELENFASDLKIRYKIEVQYFDFDLCDLLSHDFFYKSLPQKPDGVLLAAGYLGEQKKAESTLSEAELIMNTNYNAPAAFLNIVARDMESRKNGFIIGISSVAGDRGRKSNYFYGSAKAAFTSYLSGLRNRLNASKVYVMTVKPGFVKTKMTENMDLPDKLTASPEKVAHDIFKAHSKKKDSIYTKWFWAWIMRIIKLIPEKKFKTMDI